MEKLTQIPILGAHWEAKKEIPFSREFFDYEFAFAKLMSERNDEHLLSNIKNYTWMLKNYLFKFDTSLNEYLVLDDLPQAPDELSEYAYSCHLKNFEGIVPSPYSVIREHSAWFGCIYYDVLNKYEDAVNIHFANAEFQEQGPLHNERLKLRQIELCDALADIHSRFPDVQEVRGKSWLYNLPVYRQFFPKSYLEKLSVDEDEELWGRGSTIWGQFIDNQMQLKAEKAYGVLEAIKALDKGEPLSSLYKIDGLLLPPLTTYGSISDFYEMYNVKI